MICLVNEIPKISLPLAEVVKINCTYNAYSDIALFWVQNNDAAIISMLDGNMVIYNAYADIAELKEFIGVISPSSVFSDKETLTQLFGNDFHEVCVVNSNHDFKCESPSQIANSKEIFDLLNVSEFELPPYEYFAVDFCCRLNHGQLKYYALKNECAAVGISDGQSVLINGIASHKKGMGSIALDGLLAQYDVTALAVCEETVLSFYLKNHFTHTYNAGYWRKKS